MLISSGIDLKLKPVRPSGSASPLLTDLVSWYKLDEESGTRADSHASNDLTDVNTVGYMAGVIGNGCFCAAGNSEKLTLADASMHFTTAFTMSWWEYGVFNSNKYSYIKYVAEPGIGFCNGSVIYFGNYSTYYHDASIVSADVEWRHRVIAYDGSGTDNVSGAQAATDRLKYYHNGTWATLTRLGGTLAVPTSFDSNTGKHNFAGSEWAGASHAEVGWDLFGVWNRELTADEVTELYNSGSGLDYPFS